MRLVPSRWVACLILLLCTPLIGCSRSAEPPPGRPEQTTFALAALPDTALAQISQELGFFAYEGLNTALHVHRYGKPALQEVLDGKADFATVAETPVMYAALKGEKISIIATIFTTNLSNLVVGRKDNGIGSTKELKGKKIATTFGTTSEFFLSTFLITHGISLDDVQLVDLRPEAIPDALARGEIDAASLFSPFTAITMRKLGQNGIAFRDKDIYRYNFMIVATQQFIRKHPDRVRRFLKALVKAEAYAAKEPAKSQEIVARFLGEPIEAVRDYWAEGTFAVGLDQTLVLSLEDEFEWALKKEKHAAQAPNPLEFIYLDGLKSVKPDAVRILY